MYLKDESLDTYLSQSTRVLNEQVFKPHLEEVFCLIIGGEPNKTRIQQAKTLFDRLGSAGLTEKVIVIDNNCITSLKHLIIEWIIRADPSHELPLHDVLDDYGVTSILKSTSSIEEKVC